MKELCIIYNSAPHYREGIFRLIENEFKCTWFFGPDYGNIKRMDTSFMDECHFLEEKRFKGWYWQLGVQNLLSKFETFLVFGQIRCFSNWILLIRKILFNRNKKIYLWCHGWYGKESFLERIIKKTYYSMADGVFVYSNYAKRLMVSNGINENKIYVIHNSLNYNYQLFLRGKLKSTNVYTNHFGNKAYNLVFIGRLTEVKRLDLLIHAIKRLQDEGLNCNLTLIGDGNVRNSLESLVEELNLNNNVWFYGASHDELINSELLYNADLCVAPGNVGLTAIHAMAFGCPVATHNDFKNQMPEFEAVTEGKTGCYFAYQDVESICSTISKWFKNKNGSREEVRKDCYDEIDKYWTPKFQIEVIKNNLKFL